MNMKNILVSHMRKNVYIDNWERGETGGVKRKGVIAEK